MESGNEKLTIAKILEKIEKYLPQQGPLKDFIFQNTLDYFIDHDFLESLHLASEIFGYNTFLSLKEFRQLYENGEISSTIIDKIILERYSESEKDIWKNKLLNGDYTLPNSRIGQFRSQWNKTYQIDIDVEVHPILFRIICSYLDQGISIWNFPIVKNGLIESIKELESNNYVSFFRSKRVKKIIEDGYLEIESLLDILVGDFQFYEEYLFDQQFSHPGWSGLVSVLDHHPNTLIDKRDIKFKDIVVLELLLEIDALDYNFGSNWKPLSKNWKHKPINIFEKIELTEFHIVQEIWQESFEWTFYDQLITGVVNNYERKDEQKTNNKFQALFCIDDRALSFRDHIEKIEPNCTTYGTPGFFNIEFYFKNEFSNIYTKLCPAQIDPKYLIIEKKSKKRHNGKDIYFSKKTFNTFLGFGLSQTLGFWAAFKLVTDIFSPSIGAKTLISFMYMDNFSELSIENKDENDIENNLQIGFTLVEMVDRIEGLLKSINLVKDFAPIVYVIGHGASSVNNPFYATMDCGACSSRPGLVNARVAAHMANLESVRKLLAQRGINIPTSTQFIGGMHDTTRDEIMFYDLKKLSNEHIKFHKNNKTIFNQALRKNAKERSRRFDSIDSKKEDDHIHKEILKRSISLFEPRPELDHANNAVTIVGPRSLTKGLFLDKRAFLNSYQYDSDPNGDLLYNILKPIAPVCGGINLNYYFSRVDNHKLGAGTKLPHNIMGLFGVSNGIDGDLRFGLPSQMVEVHDPIRMLLVIHQFPDLVLQILKKLSNYNWYANNWIKVIAIDPISNKSYIFKNQIFEIYNPLKDNIPKFSNFYKVIEESNSLKNIPVHLFD